MYESRNDGSGIAIDGSLIYDPESRRMIFVRGTRAHRKDTDPRNHDRSLMLSFGFSIVFLRVHLPSIALGIKLNYKAYRKLHMI